eukprot:4203364-Pleurochrysis_carterae.AAC.4
MELADANTDAVAEKCSAMYGANTRTQGRPCERTASRVLSRYSDTKEGMFKGPHAPRDMKRQACTARLSGCSVAPGGLRRLAQRAGCHVQRERAAAPAASARLAAARTRQWRRAAAARAARRRDASGAAAAEPGRRGCAA